MYETLAEIADYSKPKLTNWLFEYAALTAEFYQHPKTQDFLAYHMKEGLGRLISYSIKVGGQPNLDEILNESMATEFVKEKHQRPRFSGSYYEENYER